MELLKHKFHGKRVLVATVNGMVHDGELLVLDHQANWIEVGGVLIAVAHIVSVAYQKA